MNMALQVQFMDSNTIHFEDHVHVLMDVTSIPANYGTCQLGGYRCKHINSQWSDKNTTFTYLCNPTKFNLSVKYVDVYLRGSGIDFPFNELCEVSLE